MIICAGEAIIDMLPRELAEGGEGFLPMPGGASLNSALAMARLGQDVSLLCPLSTDMFGDQLTSSAAVAGVDFSLSPWVDRPTTLAFVKLTNGSASYQFFDENSALRSFSQDELPEIPAATSAVHFGGIALAVEPCGSTYEEFARRAIGHSVISFDPNIRPHFISDIATYRSRLDRMFDLADIIKISEEDLDWYDPNTSLEAFASHRITQGASLIVTTLGEGGSVAYTLDETITATTAKVDVVDTIGAGDTFIAGLLASLSSQGNLFPDRIGKLSSNDVLAALTLANTAAAISVTRAGANPPTRAEVATFLQQLS